MYRRSDTPDNSTSPWLVRAEVTIRHGTDTGTQSRSDVTDGLRMVYKWGQDGRVETPETTVGSYGFQRGNILFTSTPPPRSNFDRPSTIPRYNAARHTTPQNLGVNVSDSGYNSEQFSPQSYSSLPLRRPSQIYNRRCKSTCSIVLQSVDKGEPLTVASQTQCGDSRCQHGIKHCITAVPEACEDCLDGITSERKAFTTHFCTRVPGKINAVDKILQRTVNCRDAASQTTDIDAIEQTMKSPCQKAYDYRRKTAPGFLRRFDHQREFEKEETASCSSVQSGISEKPVFPFGKEPEPTGSVGVDSSGKEDTAKRKSRTVHIDVYCTGSDEDADDSSYSDSSDSSDHSKKKILTVFEDDQVKVTHSRAPENRLPRGLQDDKAFLKRSAESRCESFKLGPMRMPSIASSKGYETDDVLSSLYPSQYSSYSAIRDLDSAPWSAASSCAGIGQDYDSAAATSWKDTFSDVESLMNSKASLTPCDSFEYANSSDRERIDKLEKSWGEVGNRGNEIKSKTWRSPQVERRQLLQNRKMKEFLDKHQVGWSSPDESQQESDDSGELGWSFVSNDDNSRPVRRDSTIRRTSKEKSIGEKKVIPPPVEIEDRGCMSDGAPPPSHGFREDILQPFSGTSTPPSLDKIESRVTSPFTLPEGERTEHLLKASRFGAIIGAFRKPGHHVGPAKNPSCSCEHCRRFFEDEGPRGRSRSLGAIERGPGPWFRRNKDIISKAPRNSMNDFS